MTHLVLLPFDKFKFTPTIFITINLHINVRIVMIFGVGF